MTRKGAGRAGSSAHQGALMTEGTLGHASVAAHHPLNAGKMPAWTAKAGIILVVAILGIGII